MMCRCQAPRYLADHFTTSSDVGFVCVLQTVTSSLYLAILNIYDCRAFSIAGPTVWNSLPGELTEIRRVVLTVLSSFLRQSCLVFTNLTTALEVF